MARLANGRIAFSSEFFTSGFRLCAMGSLQGDVNSSLHLTDVDSRMMAIYRALAGDMLLKIPQCVLGSEVQSEGTPGQAFADDAGLLTTTEHEDAMLKI